MLIGRPPLSGAVHDKVTWLVPGVAVRPLGALGVVEGMTLEVVAPGPEPAEFTAVMVKVYEVPFVRPVIVHEVFGVEHVRLPGEATTLYRLMP